MAAIRSIPAALCGPEPARKGPARRRDQVYTERLFRVIEDVWLASQHLWSVRLKATLPLWLPWVKARWTLTPQEEKLLLKISPATMDRRLKPYENRLKHKLYDKTKPGRWLRQTIPIQTESWNVPDPGWLESDTVSHCGAFASGTFVTLSTR